MNDIKIIKSKINKCNTLKNNKVDFSVWINAIFEKVLFIGKIM